MSMSSSIGCLIPVFNVNDVISTSILQQTRLRSLNIKQHTGQPHYVQHVVAAVCYIQSLQNRKSFNLFCNVIHADLK